MLKVPLTKASREGKMLGMTFDTLMGIFLVALMGALQPARKRRLLR